jgi:hypothetical protein
LKDSSRDYQTLFLREGLNEMQGTINRLSFKYFRNSHLSILNGRRRAQSSVHPGGFDDLFRLQNLSQQARAVKALGSQTVFSFVR